MKNKVSVPFLRLYYVALVHVLGGVATASESPILNHFIWSPIASPQQPGASFPVQVSARDINSNLIIDVNGPIDVSAWSSRALPPLLITEIDIGANDRVELSNPTDLPQDIGGLQVSFYDSTTWPAPRFIFSLPLGAVCPAGGVLELRASGAAGGSFPLFFVPTTLTWLNESQNNPIAVMLRSVDGSILDFACAVDAFPLLIPELAGAAANEWVGPPMLPNQFGARSYQRVGLVDHNNAADWVVTNANVGVLNPGLRLPMTGSPVRIAATPSLINFTNGVWAGNLSVQTNGTTVVVRADDGNGHSGESNPFYISAGPPLSLHLVSATHEGSSGVHGQQSVSIPLALSTNLEVLLTSQLPEEVSVPDRVVISAGQTEVVFDIRNFNDAHLDGPRSVTVNAAAPGFTRASATVTNYDDETASLIISTPATATEGSGRLLAAGTIFASAAPTLPIAVELASSNPSRLQVPPRVYLLTGQTSTVFDLTVVDNRTFEEPASVTVRGSVPGWAMGESVTLLHDNESTNLQVLGPTQLFEGSVGVTNGVVRLAATLSTNLHITLNSSRPDSVQVSPAVTIPAGQTSVVFNVTIVNDTLPETNRTARLTAAANRFGEGASQLTVLDDDVGTFFFERISDNQIAGSAFPVIVYAQNKDTYTIPSYNGMASVGATGAWGDVPVELATIGPFINGTWSGSLRVMAESPATKLVAQHANGATAESNPFDVAAASVTNLAVSDLAYDPIRQKLWAGLVPASGTNGSVVRIDPASGAQEATIALNNHPGKLAISDDGQYLYVGLNTTGGVARVNLGLQTIDLRFGLGPDEPTFGTLFADDMDVVAGRPQTLLVSRRVNFGGYNQGVAAYDNGVQRPDIVGPAEYGSGYRISTFDSPTNFYFAFPTGLRRLVIGPTGVSIAQEFRGNQYGSDMEFDGQLSYGTSGEVFDPNRFRVLGRFGASGWVRPVPWAGRVFFLHENQLEGFDTRSYLPVGKVAVAGVSGAPINLVYAGSNRLAFATTSGQLVILSTKMIPPSAGSDLSLSQSVNSISPKVGENFVYTISVSNRGPALATNVVVGDWLGNEVKFISAAASKSACTLTNQVVRCAVGNLSSGESALITLTVRPQTPGLFANVVRVTGGALGLNDDFNRQTDLAMFGTNLPPVTVVDLNVNDLAYDPTMNTLWTSVSRSGGNLIPSLRGIDLGTGLEMAAVPLTREPGQLAISSNGRYLYAGLSNGQAIARLDTVTRTFGAEIGAGGFTDMEVLPETPTAIAVTTRGISIFENGIYRGGSHPDLNAVVIEFGDNNSLLYGVPYGPPGYLYRLGMTNYSITLIDVTEGLFNGWGADVKKGSNFLFAADGNVINPVTRTRVTRLPVAGQACPDSRVGLVFYLSQVDGTNWSLTAFREDTLQHAWSYAISGFRGFAGRLVRCRPGALAVHTSEGQIFVFNTGVMGGGPGADLTLELVSPDGVTGDTGGHVEFTTHTENHGPEPAYGVYLTNHLSGPVELISVTLSRGTYTNLGDKVICHFGDLEPGTPVDAIVRVTGTNGGTVSNVAIVGHSGLDPVLTNNRVVTHANFIRVPVGDVSIREIRSASETSVGASTQVSIVVTNHGRDEVPNVILTYTVPAGVVVESAAASQGTVTIGEPVSVSFGTISNGATAEVSMTIRPSNAGLLVNRARLSPSRHDRDDSNNEAVSVISVTGESTSGLLQQFTLPAADIVYDTTRQQIFASLQPEPHQLTNTVVGMSILNGALSNVVRMREPVGLLAISDNGQYVYAERTTTGGISRINVPLNNADLDFDLCWPPDGAQFGGVGEMEVVPGQPQALAVCVRIGQGNAGVVVFDNGVPRANVGPSGSFFGQVYHIAFPDSATLYETFPFSFRRLSVGPSGVTLVEEAPDLVPGYESAFEYDSGLIYFNFGRVVDPVAKTIVRQYPFRGLVAPDAANGRVFFLTQSGTSAQPLLTLRAFGSESTNELWALPLPARSGAGMKLIKLGASGLAALTDAGRIFVVKLAEIAEPSADLAISQIVSANPVTVHDTVTNTITLRNEGPWAASAVTFTNRIPSGATFLSVTSNIGSCTYSDGLITCLLGKMNSGASRTIITRFSPQAVMAMTNVAGVYATEIDPNPTNNHLTTVFAVSAQPVASMPDLFLREGNAFASLQSRVRLSMPSSQSIVVRYETADGTAIAGQDYTASSGTLIFGPGVTNRSISINALVRGNTTVQSNRYFFINLSATNLAQPVYQAKVTIVEDDFISLSANNVAVSEGASGFTNAVFSVTLQPGATETVTVDYAAISGSAVVGEDLQARTGTLVFPPCVTNKVINVGVFGDDLFEPDEEFVLLFSSPSGALLSANQATGRILNDDVIPIPLISALSVDGDAVAMRFGTIAGQPYRIERSDSLSPPNWVVLREIVGTGSEAEVTDTVDPVEPQRFYRLVIP